MLDPVVACSPPQHTRVRYFERGGRREGGFLIIRLYLEGLSWKQAVKFIGFPYRNNITLALKNMHHDKRVRDKMMVRRMTKMLVAVVHLRNMMLMTIPTSSFLSKF